MPSKPAKTSKPKDEAPKDAKKPDPLDDSIEF